MTSIAQARETIREYALPLGSEIVPLNRAHARILREAIICPEDLPHFDRSAMDGYAVRANDAGAEWKVRGEIRAGSNIEMEIRSGEAVRIFTGAKLPAAGLKVIMQENVEVQGDRIRLTRPSEEFYIRRQGEDARAGETLLEMGTRLNAAAIALLATVGKVSVSVARAPCLLHLTTGDEIVAPDEPLGPGEIRNSNAFLISGLCREWGGATTHLHAPDDLKKMTDILMEMGPQNFDMILISGGSGGGKYDFAAELFRVMDAEMHFRQVALRPGKPLIFGTAGSRLVFGLPGNALSHFVCFHLFVRAALAGLSGRAPDSTAFATLAKEIPEARNNRETWWPAQILLRAGRVETVALAWKSSGDITRLPAADALIRVPAETQQLLAGTRVEYLPLQATL